MHDSRFSSGAHSDAGGHHSRPTAPAPDQCPQERDRPQKQTERATDLASGELTGPGRGEGEGPNVESTIRRVLKDLPPGGLNAHLPT